MPIEIKILIAVMCALVTAFMVTVVFCAVAVASKADKEMPKKKHPRAGCVTFRDLLEMEHPEYVNNERIDALYAGGCRACPFTYDYEEKPDCGNVSSDMCERCWNRPVPKETLERLMEGKE